jgi:hypothetical protein
MIRENQEMQFVWNKWKFICQKKENMCSFPTAHNTTQQQQQKRSDYVNIFESECVSVQKEIMEKMKFWLFFQQKQPIKTRKWIFKLLHNAVEVNLYCLQWIKNRIEKKRKKEKKEKVRHRQWFKLKKDY